MTVFEAIKINYFNDTPNIEIFVFYSEVKQTSDSFPLHFSAVVKLHRMLSCQSKMPPYHFQ